MLCHSLHQLASQNLIRDEKKSQKINAYMHSSKLTTTKTTHTKKTKGHDTKLESILKK
jgi:hypothetical protein